jgi:hypothetical protein
MKGRDIEKTTPAAWPPSFASRESPDPDYLPEGSQL